MKYFLLSNITRVLLAKLRKYHKSYDQLIVYSKDFIGEEIYSFGLYEADELQLIQQILNFDPYEYRMLDVGANIGNHTVFLSKIFKEIHSIEPHPITFQVLKLNTRNLSNVFLYEMGFSNENRKAKLIDKEDNHGGAKLSYSEGIDILIRKGDEVLSNDFAFIKIDVEGHELQVLKGLQNCISDSLPIVTFELISDTTSLDVIRHLEDLGYEFFAPYHRSIFPRNWKKHKYLRKLINECIFSKKYMVRPISEFEEDFYNLIFAVHPKSAFNIKSEFIKR